MLRFQVLAYHRLGEHGLIHNPPVAIFSAYSTCGTLPLDELNLRTINNLLDTLHLTGPRFNYLFDVLYLGTSTVISAYSTW